MIVSASTRLPLKPDIKYQPMVLVIKLHSHFKKIQFGHVLPGSLFVGFCAHFPALKILIEFELEDKNTNESNKSHNPMSKVNTLCMYFK